MGNPRKKKVTPSPITFVKFRRGWCIQGPEELVKEMALVYVRGANDRHKRVRVIEILDVTDGVATATYERKEKKKTRKRPGR